MARSSVLICLTYLVLIAGLVSGLFAVRARVLARSDLQASQADWQEWREAAERHEAGEGPVTRRAPETAEPPTLLLLRDHFAACLTLTLVVTTVLFATLAFMIRGVLGSASSPIPRDPPPGPVN